MIRDGSPIIPNEPQAYVMPRRIGENGANLIVYGNCADTEFGEMDRMLSRDWDYEGWIKRLTFLEPEKF